MAQMITMKCPSCGAQRKVPPTTKSVSCRKCGDVMVAPPAPAAVGAAPQGGARAGGARPGGRRRAGAGARRAGAKSAGRAGAGRGSRRQPAEEQIAEAPARAGARGRRAGQPKKEDNGPIVTVLIIGVGVLALVFFLLFAGDPQERTTGGGTPSDEPTPRTSTDSAAERLTMPPWKVCDAFRSAAELQDSERVLELLSVERYAKAKGREVPSDENLRLKFADNVRNDLPTWIREVFVREQDEQPGATSNEAIVIAKRSSKPAIRFEVVRASSYDPWRVSNFTIVLGGESTPAGAGDEDEGEPEIVVAPGTGPSVSGEELTPGDEDEGGAEADPVRPTEGQKTHYLSDFSTTTAEDVKAVEAVVAEVMSGDPRAEEDAKHRCRDIGTRSMPILLRSLRDLEINDRNFIDAKSLINVLFEIAPGNPDTFPNPPQTMSGRDAAVRNAVFDWLEWWKKHHEEFRE